MDAQIFNTIKIIVFAADVLHSAAVSSSSFIVCGSDVLEDQCTRCAKGLHNRDNREQLD